MSFWSHITRPLVGLSPMDGITDAACRYIVDTIGHPSVIYTEFVPVEAIKAGATRVLEAFVSHETQTPLVAQIYGTDLDGYYQSTFVVCELGYDGVDINMGCPAKSVAARGAGAGLIRHPDHAAAIIDTVNQAIVDWASGKSLSDAGVHDAIMSHVAKMRWREHRDVRTPPPVSVKTRIGYDAPSVDEWIGHIARRQIACLTVHGRTLKQLYTGKADWTQIARAATVTKQINPSISVLGSGDVVSRDDACAKASNHHLDGVLIGRATWGNPWIFTGVTPSPRERLHVARAHAHKLVEMLPQAHFLTLRKHLAWYCSGFPHAPSIRSRVLQVKTLADVDSLLDEALQLVTADS